MTVVGRGTRRDAGVHAWVRIREPPDGTHPQPGKHRDTRCQAELADPTETRDSGEARCPASAEAGRRVTCESCPIALKCNGTRTGRIRGRVILDHGPGGIGRSIARAA